MFLSLPGCRLVLHQPSVPTSGLVSSLLGAANKSGKTLARRSPGTAERMSDLLGSYR